MCVSFLQRSGSVIATHAQTPGGVSFHTYVGSGLFLGFKILNLNIWGGGGFRKINIVWCMKVLWIFWGYHKIGLYLGVIYMHFVLFDLIIYVPSTIFQYVPSTIFQ